MTNARLEHIDQLVRDLSHQDDPDRLVLLLSRQSGLVLPNDGLLTVSRRGLEAPHYRVTRSWRWRHRHNPFSDADHLPAYDRGLLGELLYANRPAVIDRLAVAADDPAREHLEGMGSMVCAPAYQRGQAQAMVVALRAREAGFTAEELEPLLLNANLLALAANNMLLAQQLDEAYRRLDAEMQRVGETQRHLLPAELPEIEGLDLAASYVTSSRAGGDYYDVFALPGGRWGLLLADVSGHGIQAAVVMTMLHTLLHAFPGPPEPPAHVFGHLNRHLLTVAPEGMFATAWYGVYDPARRELTCASAGHPPPRWRRRNRRVEDVPQPGGLPLGVVEEATWREQQVALVPGEALLLYTDGYPEGTNPAGLYFGKDGLDAVLRLGPSRAAPLVQHVERSYREFCAGRPDNDDRTLLAVVAVP